MKACFYIDGFNLYQARLKRNRGYRWLNLLDLARRLIADGETVTRVNFYTAYVSGRIDAEAVRKQHAYLAALKTLAEVHIEPGNFVISDRWVKLVHPAQARPDGYPWSEPLSAICRRRALPGRRKGSDVEDSVSTFSGGNSFQNTYDGSRTVAGPNDTFLIWFKRSTDTRRQNAGNWARRSWIVPTESCPTQPGD